MKPLKKTWKPELCKRAGIDSPSITGACNFTLFIACGGRFWFPSRAINMAKSILIGLMSFPSKKAAKDYVRCIRDRYADGDRISRQDDEFLRDLINLHSEKEEKIDAGIAYFTVGPDLHWGTTKCFYLVRHDGSSSDFSFKNCIDGKNHIEDVLAGLRHAVSDQITLFKMKEFAKGQAPYCPFDKTLLTESNCDVDHVAPATFKALVESWRVENNLSLDEIQLVDNADNQWVRSLRDSRLIESWQQFHARKATLQIISKRANRSSAKALSANNNLAGHSPEIAQLL